MGKTYCCVEGCHSNSSTVLNGKKISLHRFPRDKTLCRIWVNRINTYRQNFSPTSSSRVCSNHFEGGALRPGLWGVLPSIFPQGTFRKTRMRRQCSVQDLKVIQVVRPHKSFPTLVYEYGVGDFVLDSPAVICRHDSDNEEEPDIVEQEREPSIKEKPTEEESMNTCSDQGQLMTTQVPHTDQIDGMYGNKKDMVDFSSALKVLLGKINEGCFTQQEDSKNDKETGISSARRSVNSHCASKDNADSKQDVNTRNAEENDIGLDMDCESFKVEVWDEDDGECTEETDVVDLPDALDGKEESVQNSHSTYYQRIAREGLKRVRFSSWEETASSLQETHPVLVKSEMNKLERDTECINTAMDTETLGKNDIKKEIPDTDFLQEEAVVCNDLDVKSETNEEADDHNILKQQNIYENYTQPASRQHFKRSASIYPRESNSALSDEFSDLGCQNDTEMEQEELTQQMDKRFKGMKGLSEKIGRLRESMLKLCRYLERRITENSEASIPVVNNILAMIDEYCSCTAGGHFRFNWCGSQRVDVATADTGQQTEFITCDRGVQTEASKKKVIRVALGKDQHEQAISNHFQSQAGSQEVVIQQNPVHNTPPSSEIKPSVPDGVPGSAANSREGVSVSFPQKQANSKAAVISNAETVSEHEDRLSDSRSEAVNLSAVLHGKKRLSHEISEHQLCEPDVAEDACKNSSTTEQSQQTQPKKVSPDQLTGLHSGTHSIQKENKTSTTYTVVCPKWPSDSVSRHSNDSKTNALFCGSSSSSINRSINDKLEEIPNRKITTSHLPSATSLELDHSYTLNSSDELPSVPDHHLSYKYSCKQAADAEDLPNSAESCTWKKHRNQLTDRHSSDNDDENHAVVVKASDILAPTSLGYPSSSESCTTSASEETSSDDDQPIHKQYCRCPTKPDGSTSSRISGMLQFQEKSKINDNISHHRAKKDKTCSS